MDFNIVLKDVLTQIGTASVIVVALGVLGKLAITRFFDAGLATLKANLKASNDLELAKVKDQFTRELQAEKNAAERARDEFRHGLAARAARDDRLRAEVVVWANPVLSSVKSLENRLKNILHDQGFTSLDSAHPQPNPNWSATYDYFMGSTLYVFGEYFCWTHLLEQELSFELLTNRDAEQRFFAALLKVSQALGDYPPEYAGTGNDRQVLRLEQRAMGELLVAKSGERRACVGYVRFERRRAKYGATFEPLRRLLDNVKPGERRYARLDAVLTALSALRTECERVLRVDGPTAAPVP